jgi:hypothetical protein
VRTTWLAEGSGVGRLLPEAARAYLGARTGRLHRILGGDARAELRRDPALLAP